MTEQEKRARIIELRKELSELQLKAYKSILKARGIKGKKQKITG